LLYKQNKAACLNIQYGKRESKLPTERSRDVDIENFAIQEWQQRRDIKLVRTPGVINSADAQTKPVHAVVVEF
jgi:hypothetical protein